MRFTKMQGCGNDYVYMDCTKWQPENASELAVKVSAPKFGIGSDGLILIKSSDKADFFMEMYNADGSRSAMCGNGIRCVGKFVYDHGLTDKTELAIDTLAGVKYLQLAVKDGEVYEVTVDMGEPEFRPELIPVKAEENPVRNVPIMVGHKEYRMTAVSMGNPHAVVYVENTADYPVTEEGPLFEHHACFPERVNAEFIQVLSRRELNMRVWERGSGETWACGTGACASVVASVLNGLTDEEVTVHMLGGDLRIRYDRGGDGHVYMTGPAVTVFEGDYRE